MGSSPIYELTVMDNYNNYQPDYNQGYDNQGYDPYGGYPQQPQQKSIKGLKIMIVILAVILGALSVLYFTQTKQMKAEYEEARDTLTARLTTMLANYDTLRTENDTLAQHLTAERFKADSLLETLKNERNLTRKKIKDYEKRLSYMRTVMEGYIHQIDSLNTLNQKLVNENITYRKEITSARLRADMAEEKAQELSTKVQKGAVIRARNIALVALNQSDKVVTRVARAARLRVDFVLVGNELSQPGERNVYARIIGPDGYVLANRNNATFDFKGDMITYSATRQVDYQNEDLSVSLFYNDSGITAGKYQVMIYIDGHMIGSTEIILR